MGILGLGPSVGSRVYGTKDGILGAYFWGDFGVFCRFGDISRVQSERSTLGWGGRGGGRGQRHWGAGLSGGAGLGVHLSPQHPWEPTAEQ